MAVAALSPTASRTSGANRSSRTATTVVLACLGVFCAYLQISAISVSLATIGRDLHASTTALQWVFDAFTIPVAALVLSFGVLGDLAGRKRIAIAGLALTVTGNLISLLAPGTGVLLTGRAIAGVGAAALLPATLALITHAVPEPARRGHYVAFWTGALNVGLAVGPFIAGVLLAHASWRWVFLPVTLVPLAVLILSACLLEDSRAAEGRRLDVPGQILAAAGIFALIYGVIEGGQQGWTSPQALVALPLAALVLTGFVLVEQRSPSPMLRPQLFRSPAFLASVLAGLLAMFSLIGSNFVLSLFLGAVQRLTPFGIALRLLCLYGAVLVTGQLAGRVLARTGPRTPLISGLLLAGVGLFTLRGVQPDSSLADLGWRLALLGLGFGLVLTSVTAAAVNAVPRHLAGMASAAINTFRQVGAALGPAILGVILTTATTSHLTTGAASISPGAFHTLAQEGLGGLTRLTVSPAGQAAIGHSAASAIHTCATVSGCGMLLAALLVATLMPRRTHD
ncbi:MFS transporter [Micromonospora soli]|uniref:MFS transporter n=1 Tax=Micromonospora sp. NBRC 110009 TaxID=3061627 RepID=UPI002673BBAC|nr:MFS transporter [Micromonospora sp. NBRC 110009]WKT97946.1 MFS transporter [Micromonospora sp. NBRC 110009]